MEFPRGEPAHAWRYHAKCMNADNYPAVEFDQDPFEEGVTNTELFFPPRDVERYTPIAIAAKEMCYGKDGKRECPVRRECLLYAIEGDDQHGIYGGKSHRERAALERRHAAQHPELTIKEYVFSEHCR